jgi:hypothetical protein
MKLLSEKILKNGTSRIWSKIPNYNTEEGSKWEYKGLDLFEDTSS